MCEHQILFLKTNTKLHLLLAYVKTDKLTNEHDAKSVFYTYFNFFFLYCISLFLIDYI